jgi:MFS family permease
MPVTGSVRAPGLLRSDRDFRWYWSGQTLSFVGSQVTATALPLVAALTLGAGPGGVSVVATASWLPNLVLPLLVGHWLEGRSKRRVMVVVDLLRAVALLTVPVAYAAGGLSLALLAAIGFAVGVGNVFFDVGGFAYVPTLVPRERLSEANRAMQGSSTMAQVGGPGLAGVLVQVVGAPFALVADAASYLASVVGIRAARRPEPSVDGHRRGRLRDGLSLIVRDPYLRPLTMHAALYNGAAQVLVVNLVIWLVRDNDVQPGLYGLALACGGAGAFVGTMLALRLAGRLGYGRAFLASLCLSCGVPLLTATLPWSGGTLGAGLAGLQLVACIGLGSANVLSTTLRQTVIPPGQLARTVGAYRAINFGIIPIGSALAGVLGEAFGSRAGVAVGTVGMAASALPMLAPAIRRLERVDTVAAYEGRMAR